MEKQLYRVDEVAQYFDVSKSLVYRWIECGDIEAEKYRGTIRISYDAIIAYRENHKMKPLE
ncbi:MAG TPA: helix-turn-helix domain-containing protein [Smithella sp.]|nr:helix-turn-helix domain-containing protein [Smithella sp.]